MRVGHEVQQARARPPPAAPRRPGPAPPRRARWPRCAARTGCTSATRRVPRRPRRRDRPEGPVHQQVVDHAELAGPGHAEGEATTLRAYGAAARPALATTRRRRCTTATVPGAKISALDRGVRLDGTVPVEVVRGHVEHRGRERRGPTGSSAAGSWTARRPARRRLRLADRLDAPGCRRCRRRRSGARRREHRGEHADRGGLAVGAGQRQPVRDGVGEHRAQPPGQLDLADHLDPGRGGGGEQRRCGGQPGVAITRSVPAGQPAGSPAADRRRRARRARPAIRRLARRRPGRRRR